MTIKPLSGDKILASSKLKAFTDCKINLMQNLIVFLGRVENMVGREENDGYQHFLPFRQRFQKVSFSGLLKVKTLWERVNSLPLDKD